MPHLSPGSFLLVSSATLAACSLVEIARKIEMSGATIVVVSDTGGTVPSMFDQLEATLSTAETAQKIAESMKQMVLTMPPIEPEAFYEPKAPRGKHWQRHDNVPFYQTMRRRRK